MCKKERPKIALFILSRHCSFSFSSLNCVGSHPFYLLERGTEITGIGKPDFIGYFIDIEIGICE